MKILQIHKYCSRKRGGGSVTAFFETVALLKRKGHLVKVFSMRDPKNGEEFPAENFAEYFDLNQPVSFLKKIQLAFRCIFNFQAQKSLEKFLFNFQPQVAHIHNIYHYLTPAIFFTLKKKGIPLVMKLSDYKLLCPNYKLFNKGKICQKCRGGKYFYCFWGRCVKNSFLFSAIAMIEAYVHRFLGSYKKIDLFLAPSVFMKNKCIEWGIAPERVEVLRNTVDEKNFSAFLKIEKAKENDRYFLFYGRLSEEKGGRELLAVVAELKKQKKLFQRRLLIVGRGPQEDELQRIIKEKHLEGIVSWQGFQQGEKLKKIIRKADFVVLPSIWWDNSPLVISEAQLLEKPVLASVLGGSPEMIIDGKTGLLFNPLRKIDFLEKLIKMLKMSEEELEKMGKAGRKNILKLNDSENYYQQLLNFYQKVLN